jgi:hypothetical protein
MKNIQPFKLENKTQNITSRKASHTPPNPSKKHPKNNQNKTIRKN